MSHDNEETRLIELAQHAAEARTRLKEDVEALAYKLSPENLKKEALEATSEMAAQAKAKIQLWASHTQNVVRDNPLEVALGVGFSGLLIASIVRRDRALLFGALACGAAGVGLVFRRAQRRAQRRALVVFDA